MNWKRWLHCKYYISLLQFHQKQADARPNQLSDADDECHEDARAGGHSQSVDGHEESSLAPTQLEGHEKEEVSKERREGKYEDALEIVGRRHDEQEDEKHLKGGKDAAT